MKTNTYMNFAKRFVMMLAAGLMAVNMWGAYSGTFNRISSLSEISSGDSVMLVIQDAKTLTSGYAVQNNSTNYASVTIDGTSISCTNNKLVWAIKTNSTNYYFQKSTDYIVWTSSTTLSAKGTTSNTYTWTISAIEGYPGYFRISSTGTGNRDMAVYGSSGFKAYSSDKFVNQFETDPAVELKQYDGAMSIYKKGAATHTVTINRNNNAYGTVSQASVSNLANNTSISASDNVLTIGTTTVTATPTEQDADYNYGFSSWDGIPAGGKVTGNITVTANFTRTARSYVNYRTKCCQPLDAPENVEVSVTGTQAAKVTWDDVEHASGYEYSLDNGENWTAATSPLSLTSAQGLVGATQYSIQVRATGTGDYCAEGTAADAVAFKTWATVTAASNNDLMGTAQVSKDNENWASSVAAADGTKIYLKYTAASDSYEWYEWATPASGSISDNEFTGWSGNVTVTANFRTKSLTKLATPEGMASSSITAISAVVSWTAVEHASTYTVTCEKTDDHSTTGIVIGDIDGTSCTITGLTANTGYTWTVKAVGDNSSYKDGDACEGQTFTTDKKKPTTVEITTAPSKTTYNSGEAFDATGMVVKVTYNNGDIDAAYTGYTVSPSTVLSSSNTYVTVTATMNEVSASVEQAITVNAKLTWKAAGAEDVITYASSGKVVMPTGAKPIAPSCLGDFDTFQGWSASAISVSTDVEPSYVSEETDAAADATFYAVFAKMGEGDEEDASSTLQVVRSTNAPSSPWTDNSEEGKGTKWTFSGLTFNNTNTAGVPKSTESEISIELPSEATSAISIAFTGTGSAWSGTSDTYFTLTGNGVSGTIGTIDRDHLSYAFSAADITANKHKAGTYTLTHGGSKGAWIDHITINYKKVGQVPVEWATTCCTPWDAPAILYSVPSGWKNGDAAVSVSIAEGDVYGAVTYESSDESVLTVAADGSITAVAPGTATVTATWAGATVGSVKYCEASSVSAEIEVSGTVTVKFDGNGNDNGSMSDQEITYKTATNLTSNAFSKTGYSFGGWAESAAAAAAKTVLYTNGQEVTLTIGCTLYAIWNINSHAVTLTQPTGNTIEATGAANLASVAYGTDITLTASENDGYVFTGWDATNVVLDNTNPVVFYMPDKDVTVTATYSTYTWETASPRYTVTTAPKTTYNKVETFSTAGVVIKENFKRSDDNTITKQVAYNGAWTAKLNGVAIANGADLSLDDNNKTLKLYIGEDEIASYTLKVNDIVADLFIDGLWGLSFDPQTDTYDMPTPANQTPGVADCKDHYTFAGWILEDNAENPTAEDLIKGNDAKNITAANNTYYAVWSKSTNVEKEFSISKTSGFTTGTTLNSDISYGTQQNGTQNAPFATTTGDELRLYKPGSNQSYGNSITFTASNGATITKIELTASGSAYKYIASTYTTSGLSDGSVTEGAIVHDNLSTANFTIINTSGGRIDITGMKVTYSKEVTEVDYITDCDPRYEISFDANGGEGSYDKLTKKADVSINLPDGSALSREHHTFKGWTEDQAGAGTLYTTTYTVPANDVTLYAQWNEDHHAFVHFMDGGNDVEGSPIKVYDGGTYNLLPELEAENKEFIGWSYGGEVKAAGLTNQHMSNPAEDKTYTAEWMTMLPKPNADVDLTGGKWILVKDANQLNAGDFIVIAAAEYNMAMSTTQNNANRQGVAVSKSNDTLSFATNVNVAPLFLQYDEQTGFYTLYDRAYDENNGGYLYSNNSLKTQAGITMQALWSITIADKKATLEAQGDNTERVIRYNTDNGGIFADYNGAAASTKDVAIYKWYKTLEAGTTDVEDVKWTDAVIVPNGATLTANDDASLESVIVEAGGKVSGSANLTVNDLTINSEPSKSGQVTGSNVSVNGALYLEIKLCDGTMDAEASRKWYCISAPFNVNMNGGFFWADGTEMVLNTHFQMFEFDGEKRASTGNGWKRVSGTMKANTAYFIGFDDERIGSGAGMNQNTIKLKATANTIPTATPMHLDGHDSEITGSNDWYGLGNPALHYVGVNKTAHVFGYEVQGYDVVPHWSTDFTGFVVGSAFFVQANDFDLSFNNAASAYHAPKRQVEEYSYCVEISKESASRYDNRIFVRASEDAESEFVQGKDEYTLNGTSSKYGALLWTENYGGKRLAIEEAPLINGTASYVLTLSAPANGTYSISVAAPQDNADLYLTYDGTIIWNLSESAYTVDLNKGITNGYGLVLRAKAPSVVTGVDQINAKAGAQKVIIDEHVYILRGGQMYDVNGKMVK